MVKSFLVMVALLGGYYVQQEGLPKPELVGERVIAERNEAAQVCAAGFTQNYYAANGIVPTLDQAVLKQGGKGFQVSWGQGPIAMAPGVSIDCYTVGTSIIHLAVNGDTIVSREI